MLNYLAKLATTPGGVLLGLLIGVFSLVVGLVGFSFTLKQLKQVKNVADAQQSAISNLKFRLAQQDIIQECAKAERAILDIKTSLTTANSDVPLISFDNLALPFVNILEGSHSLTDAIQERLRIAISDINKMSEVPTRSGTSRSAQAKQAAKFREYHAILAKIRALVQQEQQA